MKQLMRFGRRVPLPAIMQIIHELFVAQQNDNAQQANEAKSCETIAQEAAGDGNSGSLTVSPKVSG